MTSKRVQTHRQESFQIRLRPGYTKADVKSARKELQMFIFDYYSMDEKHKIHKKKRKDGGLLLFFKSGTATSGTDYNPMVFPDTRKVEDFMEAHDEGKLAWDKYDGLYILGED